MKLIINYQKIKIFFYDFLKNKLTIKVKVIYDNLQENANKITIV